MVLAGNAPTPNAPTPAAPRDAALDVSLTVVAKLRAEVYARGGMIANLQTLDAQRLLHRINLDVGLAADALLMQPRPGWVAELVGR